MLIIIFVRFINLPAWLVLGVWIAGQFVAVPSALAGADGGVAYFAHIGGFIAGMCLVPFFKRSDVPLFGANDTPPNAGTPSPFPFPKSGSRRATGIAAGAMTRSDHVSWWKIGMHRLGPVRPSASRDDENQVLFRGFENHRKMTARPLRQAA